MEKITPLSPNSIYRDKFLKKSKEFKNSCCVYCKCLLYNKHDLFITLVTYDEKNKTGFHHTCKNKYNIWKTKFINEWARIGWYAKIDIQTLGYNNE